MKNVFKRGITLLLCLFCVGLFAQINYGEALQKSLFFYEAQQSGTLPSWNRVSWRDDSALNDGSDVNLDLTGGWYDAGDHVKFGFPMAYSVTTLAWGGIEYKDAYEASGQMDILKRNLRHVTDYFIKCHTAPNEFYGQVGNGGTDHAFWGSPEVMIMNRPAYKIDANNPGSDLAGETAAALAATSILFQDSDPTYSATLLSHAVQLYDFADNYRGIYSESINDAAGYYRSYSGYNDELVWGAAWLYRATNDVVYLNKAIAAYENLGNEGQSDVKAYKWGLAWDDKSYGSYVLMAQLTGEDEYKTDAERHLDFWTTGYNGERINYSPGGQAHLTQWGSLRHSQNTAFLAFVYSDKVAISAAKKTTYHDFAVNQANYALGDNPINRSFMVGFGNNPAYNPHHRSGHGAWGNNLQNKPDEPSHILYGALVGGPSSPNDQFVDDRGDFVANEVATDYNACFTGVLARMYDEFGGTPLTNFPIIETPNRAEIRTFSKFNSNNASGSTISIMTQNRTAWPSRVTDKLSYHYFFDISEGVNQGFTIDDYDVDVNGLQGSASYEVKVWDAAEHIYYVDVSLEGEQIAPIGDPQFRRETQIHIRVSNGVPYDTSNDWSAQGLNGSEAVESTNIPVFDDDVLVFGDTPGGSNTPVASFTATPLSGIAPLQVAFDASASSDPNGDPLTYNWNFDNGQTSSSVSPTITYSDTGTYQVSLTVSDGVNVSSEVTETITVTDGSPVAVFSASPEFGVAPLTVTFDASASQDPTGGSLSYSWDFGNGDTSTSVNPSTTYTTLGAKTVSLTVANAIGQSTVTKVITVTDGTFNCDFGTPRSTALPSLNDIFDYVYVLGTGGPNLDNVTQIQFNWDLANNGIYQFGFNTNDGVPSYYFNLSDSMTHNMNSTQPDAELINTGVSGMDGAYWVTIDSGNLVMVSKTGGFTLYFTDSPTEPVCSSGSSAIAGISQESVITNRQEEITTNQTVQDDVLVSKTKVSTAKLMATCDFGTPIGTPLPSLNDIFDHVYVLGTGGPNLNNVTQIQFNWDLANNGIYQFGFNTNDGVPSYYFNLSDTMSHNMNAVQPDATLISTGVSGMDGEYWMTIDDGNLIMVSKTGDFTLYFTDSPTPPDCDGNGNTPPEAIISATPLAGEPPLLVNFNGSGSSDDDGDALTYNWDFDDGNTATGVTAQHTFTSEGSYTVTLTVNDGNGGEDVAQVTITVSDDDIEPPVDNEYINRFVDIRNEFYNPANGYFSADGSPHHSIETLIVEAPDYGHVSTSELYSYWIWLEAMHGRITSDWQPLENVWQTMENYIIPSQADQPTNSFYNPSSPASYASEHPLPEDYPSQLDFGVPVGIDPVSPDLTATYGADVYQMHWLLDNDNFYEYGNRGDGVSTPSYINTFQRGEQESVFETIPHPSWESFDWGGPNGFLPLFIGDQNYARQWRYTSAPDADARAVQAIFWAQRYAEEQQSSLSSTLLGKASKMGDYLRLAMFDKYFKELGVQNVNGSGQGYNSAHYLMSWYISWGGAVDTNAGWAFRISASHCHFGYQNPVAAYALTEMDELIPISQNGESDWEESLQRQMEFYTWLQSPSGAIAGGATNSWNGNYSTYPSGKSTFYDMAYDDNPVYHDPGSGTWFGWQAWSMERVAEYYYLTNNILAKNLMDNWATWVKNSVQLVGNNDFLIPATLEWSGEPDTWNPSNPGSNSGLSVSIVDYGKDLGIAASTAKALIFYAAATERYETRDEASKDLAKEILDRMWVTYRDDKGLSSTESRGDFTRIFEQEVYVPNGFTGTMGNGDVIEPGITFLDIRSKYLNDPEFSRLEEAYNNGQDFTQNYHRSWAQIEIALANAEYGFFFGEEDEIQQIATTNKTLDMMSERQDALIITPIPVKDVIELSSNVSLRDSKIRIINLSGRIVMSTSIQENQTRKTIDLQRLQSGVYVLEVLNTKTGIKTNKKIVKE